MDKKTRTKIFLIILKPKYVNFMNYSKSKKSVNWFFKVYDKSLLPWLDKDWKS